MNITEKLLKKITNLYNDTLHFYFSQDPIRELDLDDKPFRNLAIELIRILEHHPFFCEDLFFSAINWEIETYDTCPEATTNDNTKNLITHIEQVFEINKQKHFILVPLQNSGLKKCYSFDRFHFVKRESREQLIEIVSQITGLAFCDVRNYMEHTEKSRSKDFLQSNLLVIEVEGQTANIKQSAFAMGQTAISLLLLIHDGVEYRGDGFSSLFHGNVSMLQENKHVAILAKDDWRVGHGYHWNAHLNCDIDLDFLESSDNQNTYTLLYHSFSDPYGDELTRKFYNAFTIYSKARYQLDSEKDETIALLLLWVAIESLITEERNEKRLRISAILPRLVTVKNYSKEQFARVLNRLYQGRNDFVHAGKKPAFWLDKFDIGSLQIASAKLIMSFVGVDSKLELREGETRSHAWNRYVDDLFDSVIFGTEEQEKSVTNIPRSCGSAGERAPNR